MSAASSRYDGDPPQAVSPARSDRPRSLRAARSGAGSPAIPDRQGRRVSVVVGPGRSETWETLEGRCSGTHRSPPSGQCRQWVFDDSDRLVLRCIPRLEDGGKLSKRLDVARVLTLRSGRRDANFPARALAQAQGEHWLGARRHWRARGRDRHRRDSGTFEDRHARWILQIDSVGEVVRDGRQRNAQVSEGPPLTPKVQRVPRRSRPRALLEEKVNACAHRSASGHRGAQLRVFRRAQRR